MKKVAKFVMVLVLIAAVVLGAGLVFVRFIFSEEQVRATIVPRLEQSLGRSMELGRINISLLSGIVIEGLHIKAKDGSTDFVRADKALLRYRLWPLLKLQFEVDEIRLEQAYINLLRSSTGELNCADLFAHGKNRQEHQAAQTPAISTPNAGAAAAAIRLSIERLQCTGGQIVFTDQYIAAPAALRYSIGELDLEIRDFTLNTFVPFALSCNINSSPFKLRGTFNLMLQQLQAQINLQPLDLTPFKPYFKTALPGALESTYVSADLHISADPNKVNTSGSAALEHIDITLEQLPDMPIANAALRLEYTAEFVPQTATLNLKQTHLNINGIRADISGTIQELSRNPSLDLSISAPEIEVKTVLEALPAALRDDIKTQNPQGRFSLQARIQGGATDGPQLLQHASLSMDNMQAEISGLRPRLNGDLVLESGALNSRDLTLDIGANSAAMEITAQDIFARPMLMTHHIHADNFDLDAILGAAASPVAGAAQDRGHAGSRGGNGPAQEPGPFAIPLTLDGSMEVGQTRYQGLDIADLNMRYRLEDNILHITNLSGTTCDGTFIHKARINLGKKGLDYTGSTKLQGLQADPLITALAPASAHTLFGSLNLDLDFSGHGTQPENIKRNLVATGAINMDAARISGSTLTQELAGFLNLAELRDIRFDTCSAKVSLRDASASVTGDFSGTNLRARPTGSVGLNGALDLALNARLAPRLARKLDHNGHIAGLFTDAEGWAMLPLKLRGTYAAPRLSLDETALQQQATRKAVETLQQRILDKIAPKGESATSDAQQEPHTQEDATRKLIDDAFKSIFGH